MDTSSSSGGIKGILESTTALVSNIFGSRYPMTKVKSRVDGKIYKVRDMPDKQDTYMFYTYL